VKKGQAIATGALVWCDACDLGTTLAQPDDRTLSAAYDLSAYYTHGASHMAEVTPGLIDRLLLKCAYLCDGGSTMDARGLLARVPQARTVLDIGCGSGDLLAALAGEGRRLVAVEPDANARAMAAARGLEVLPGTAEDLPETLSGQRFDLVTLTHVLEHCRDPLRALHNIRELRGGSGVLYCEVPNCGSIYFRALAEISEMLDVPRHLHFLTRASLTRMCEAAGRRVFEHNYHGYARHFSAGWRGWENRIHAMLAGQGAAMATPRRSLPRCFALVARSALARPDRKYDCLGVFARAA
jgi:SAM-dependent methyltransferase